MLVNAAGPWVDAVLSGALGKNNVHNVRLVQGSHIVVQQEVQRPPRLFLPEPGWPDHVRHPLRGRFHPDRHHRSATITGNPADVQHQRRRGRLPLQGRERVFPRADRKRTTSSGPIPPCARCSTTAPAKAQEATRDYVLRSRRRQGRGPAAQRFRRQADDLSPPERVTRWKRSAMPSASRVPSGPPAQALPGGDFPAKGYADEVAKLHKKYPFLAAAPCASAGTPLRHARVRAALAAAANEAALGHAFRRRPL